MLIADYLENCFLKNHKNNLIITENLTLSYEDCNKLSDFFSNEINKKNTNSNIVSIIMEKGWEQVIAVFSVLKSGKAYLPININESTERISEILKICEVEIVLSKQKLCQSYGENLKEIPLSMEYYLNNYEGNLKNQEKLKMLDALAYIIFTSGSTGLPKGVMINHNAVLNTLFDINERFNIGKDDRILSLSALNFDLSVYDIFGSVLAGACIVIPDENKENEPRYLAELIMNKKVTIWNSVPVLMEMLVSHIERTETYNKNISNFLSLRLVLLSGDWIPVSLPERIKKIFKNAKVVSLGGATEASIWSITYEINKIDKKWKSIPYGKPMKNQFFYILNEKYEEISYGEIGELYIGGKGLAEGYWKDEKNTKDRFIFHEKFEKIYKTGDLGRYMSDGNIEFIGRVDSQIKINGFRIELSAVESSILGQENIDQVVVVPIKSNDGLSCKSMIAYIKSDLEYSNSEKWKLIETALTDKVIKNWKKAYDAILSKEKTNNFNTSGWISSYTGFAIPKEEMEEWVDLTVKKILALKPKKVLEIGCGAGLLFFKMINHIEEYSGTDFSTETLKYLEKCIEDSKIKKNISLYAFAADEILKTENQYDTIIINSVTQYFPTLDYMFKVIDSAILLSKSGGNIFVGDVRNHENIEHYYLSSILYKLKNMENNYTLNYELYSLTLKQKELSVSPRVFIEYFLKNPRVTDVEIQIKSGKYDNEMNNFRYDVVIRVENEGEKIQVNPEDYEDWEKENMDIAILSKKLLSSKNDFLFIKNISNRRIFWLDELLNNFKDKKLSDFSFGKINEYYSKNLNFSADQYDLKRIAEESGYDVILTASNFYTMKKIDAIFYKKTNEKHNAIFTYKKANLNKDIDNGLYNSPVKNMFISDLIAKTKNSLKVSLPYYMVPDKIIYLDKFPISENRKIDRKKMLHSDIENRREIKKIKIDDASEVYQKFMFLLEKTLNNTFLNIEESFRDNGGTSLDAVHASVEINNEFSISVDVGYILDTKVSIKEIGNFIDKKVNQKSTDFLSVE